MRLLLDEHFSPQIAAQLRGAGHDAESVAERPDLKELADEELLRRAHAEGRALLTENVQDFMPIHGAFLSRGEAHSGLLFTSPRRFPRTLAGFGPLVTALASLLGARHAGEGLATDVAWL